MDKLNEKKNNDIEMYPQQGHEQIFIKSFSNKNNLCEDGTIAITNHNNGEDQSARVIEDDPLLGKMILDVDKGFLVDERDFDGMDNDNIRDPDIFDKLEEEVNIMHPVLKKDNGFSQPYPFCKTNTGIMGGCQHNSSSDLLQMGLGIVVYFKILKAFSIVFFIINIINIPLYYIYMTTHGEFQVSGYRDDIFKTTLGNVGSSLKKCMKIPFSDFSSSQTYPLHLDCNNYTISSIAEFGASSNLQVQLENLQQCVNYTTYLNVTTDPGCNLKSQLNTLLKNEKCLKTSSCDVKLNLNDFRKYCLYTNGSKIEDNLKPSNVYITYECYDEWIRANKYLIPRTIFAYGVVGIDCASIICLLIAIVIISTSQRKTDEYFKENVVEINDYTLHIRKLKLKNSILKQELDSLLAHIYKVFKKEVQNENNDNIIYDINYPILTHKKLDLILEKNKVTENLNSIKANLEHNEKYFTTYEIEQMRKNVNKLREKEEKLRKEILNSNEKEMVTVDDMYITFTQQKYKNIIKSSYKRGKCRRCCLICCCQSHRINHLYFKGKWLIIGESTDEPSNIRWENVPYSSARRLNLRLFAVIVALIVISCSLGIFIGTKYAQIEISKNIDTDINCNFFPSDIHDSEIIAEADLQQRQRINTYCYCKKLLIETGVLNTKNQTISYIDKNTHKLTKLKPCETWVDNFIYSEALIIGTFLLVPFVNIILSIVLTQLTELERNKTVSINASSNMWKSFLLQAIVILLVNVSVVEVKNWRADFPFFTGIYSDFDPRWYQNVGVTIIFCLILNIGTPHIYPLVSFLFNKCQTYCDKKCCNNGRKTKKNTRSEYLNLYVGPQFNIGLRYSQLLTTMFTVLMYSSGMPILYLCCFLYLLVTYWVDKWLILRFYRNPAHIDLFMSKLFNHIILYGIIIHFCFGIWTYGNDQILTNSTNLYLESLSDLLKNLLKFQDKSFEAEFLKRMTYTHNIIVLIFLSFLILYLIIRVFLLEFIKRLFCCCCFCKEDVEKIQDISIYNCIRIKGLYKNHQLRKATYFKMQDGKQYEFLIGKYLKTMIDVDRTNIKRRLSGLTKLHFSESNKNFDQEIPPFMKNLKKEEKSIIQNDFSYNIAYFPEFKDVVYYEFILPYLKIGKE